MEWDPVDSPVALYLVPIVPTTVVCFVLSSLLVVCVPAELYPASPPDLSPLSSLSSEQPWRHSVSGWEQDSQHRLHHAALELALRTTEQPKSVENISII